MVDGPSPLRFPAGEALFERSDAMLFCNLSTLPALAGVPAWQMPRLILKEQTDNALDSSEAAGRPGEVVIRIAQTLVSVNQSRKLPTTATIRSHHD